MALFLNRFPSLTILLSWLIIVLIIWPAGDFPLNDDWAYTKSVEWLVNGSEFKTVDWPAMNLIGQTIVGATWCKVFGFGFLQLRVLTIVLAGITLVFTYKLILKLINKPTIALLSTLTLMVNPLFVNVSFSFMTEVYFLLPVTIALYYFLCYLREVNKHHYIWLFFVFTCVAISVRQTGVFLVFTGLFTGLICFNRQRKKQLLLLLVSLLCLGFYYGIQYFVSRYFNPNSSYMGTGSIISELLQRNIMAQMFYRTGTILLTCGLFLLPITIPLFLSNFKSLALRHQLSVFAIMIPFVIPMIREFTFFPQGNVFYAFGTGALTLKDQLILNSANDQHGLALLLLQLIAFLGGILLLYSLVYIGMQHLNKRSKIFYPILICLLLILMLCGSFFLPPFFFDRYLVILMLPAIVFLVAGQYQTTIKIKGSYIIIAFFCLFSILSTKTYLNWNKSRWEALRFLTEEKVISPLEIDGGFEFNGWHQTAKVNYDPNKSWWFVKDDKYVVSLKPILGYKIMRQFPYTDFVLLQTKNIYVQERIK